jgi:tight adherence protein C
MGSATLANWIVLGLVFAAVMLVVLALAPLVLGRSDIKARLASQGGGAAVDEGPGSIRNDLLTSRWAQLLHEIEARGLSLTDDASGKIADKLQRAGFDQLWAPRAFTLARAIGTLALPILVTIVLAVGGSKLSNAALYSRQHS